MIVDCHVHLRAPDCAEAYAVAVDQATDHPRSSYVVELSAPAASDNFDVLSHPDLAKINGVRGSDFRYQEFASVVDDAGVGAPIRVASDAHKLRFGGRVGRKEQFG